MIYLVYALLLFSPVALWESPPSYLIVWNVGQGAWSTLIQGNNCWHFDAGGEKFPAAVVPLCRDKNNRLFISHDDMDHISFILRIKHWPQVCLFQKPRKISSPRKEKIFSGLQPCPPPGSQDLAVRELQWNVQGKNSNDLSRVYYLSGAKALFTGDSSAGEEKLWSEKLNGLPVKWWL